MKKLYFARGGSMAGKGKKPLTVEELRQLAADLKARTTLINYLAKVLEESGEDTVEAMGMPMVERGIAHIDNFIRDCKRALGEL